MNKPQIYLKNQPLSEAKDIWEKALQEIDFYNSGKSCVLPVDDCLGRILAEPVFAVSSSPGYNASAMDGIAVNFLDTNGASETTPVVLSGSSFERVNTGNAIKKQYNAVVMIEDVHFLSDSKVELIQSATPWQHIRAIGEDIVSTELILPAGHTIRPIDQGAMLAAGVTEVSVVVPPKTVVIPTGSELIQPGEKAVPGNIIEFNSRIISGYLTGWGANSTRSLPVEDKKEKLREKLLDCVGKYDIVIINAGASAGTKDFTSSVLSEIGQLHVHGVAIKPGKPVMLATVNNTPVIGLPGYPVSAVLNLHLFVREMIYKIMGQSVPQPKTTPAILSRPIHSTMGTDQFVRVTLGRVGRNLMATPAGKGAGAVMSMVRADGLLTIPRGNEGIGAGETVDIELLRTDFEIESTLISIGSHDNILDLIASKLFKQNPPVRISSAHVGSMGGLIAIKRGEAHIGGTHLLDEDTGEYNISFIKRHLKGLKLQLINLCYREQGLIVRKGNPQNIKTFADIVGNNYLFINRQRGAGTRLLTDKIIRENSIDPSTMNGYEREEYTHMSVAAAVANGSADCGMGILAAARALDLDFVPVAEERYDLVVPTACLDDYKVVAFLDLIRNDMELKEKIMHLGGYNLRDCGKIMYEQ